MKKEVSKQRLMEMAGITDEAVFAQGDQEALKATFPNLPTGVAGAIEDGYYALTDNLPNLINDLQKAVKHHEAQGDPQSKGVSLLRQELEIYKNIEKLVNQSMLGAVL
jgi:hypothetical protein